MAVNNLYRLSYHFEKNGIKATDTASASVIASATDKGTLFTVLNNNSKVPSGFSVGNFVIESIGHVADAILS